MACKPNCTTAVATLRSDLRRNQSPMKASHGEFLFDDRLVLVVAADNERLRRRRSRSGKATLIVTLVLHVLFGVVWAGSTFVLARTGGYQADRFFRPQMGAASSAVLTRPL